MLTPTGITAAAYKAAVEDGNPQRIKLTAIGQTYGSNVPLIFTAEDIEIGGALRLSSFFNGETDLVMGKAVMDELTVNLFRSDKTAEIVWSGEFKLELGVDVTETVGGTDVTTTYWVQVGIYIGKRPERSVLDNVIEFHAVDRMSMFDRPAQDYLETLTIDESHPVTVADLYHGICTYCGVQYATGNELTYMMNRSYYALPFDGSGMTCREIIAMIAEANCCYARIGADGKIRMRWFEDHLDSYFVYRRSEFAISVMELDMMTDQSLKKTWLDLESFKWEDLRYYLWGELEGAETPFKVHALNVRQMEEDSGVMIPAAADRNIYMIVDNPFLKTADNAEVAAYLTPIYDRLAGFGAYVPMHVECTGNWLVEPGDVISVEVGRGNQVRMPIFVRELKWNGACRDTYEATGNLQRETVNPYVNQKMAEGGRMHVMRRTVDEAYEQIQNEFGNYSTTQQTAEMIGLYVATKADIIYSNTAPTWLNRPAEPYSLRTYAVGEYCLQTVSGVTKSYRCTTAITTAHAWNASEWTVDVLPVAEGTIWVDTSPYLQTEADAYDPAETYNSGDQCEHGGSVYTCNTDSTTGTWDSTKWDLYESPVPKNQWNKYNGSTWDNVTDNTSYERKSGIEITDDGVKITGNKYVRIKANEDDAWYFNKQGFILVNNELLSQFSMLAFQVGMVDMSVGWAGATTVAHVKEPNTVSKRKLIFATTDLNTHYGSVICQETHATYNRPIFYPYSPTLPYYGDLGKANNGWDLYSGIIYGREYSNSPGSGYITFAPSVAYASTSHFAMINYFPSNNYFSVAPYLSGDSMGFVGTIVTPSSRSVKKNIRNLGLYGDVIDKLNPVEFTYKADKRNERHFGLIYEDTIEILPEICEEQESGDGMPRRTIDYVELVPILLKEIQDLRKRIAELEAQR